MPRPGLEIRIEQPKRKPMFGREDTDMDDTDDESGSDMDDEMAAGAGEALKEALDSGDGREIIQALKDASAFF